MYEADTQKVSQSTKMNLKLLLPPDASIRMYHLPLSAEMKIDEQENCIYHYNVNLKSMNINIFIPQLRIAEQQANTKIRIRMTHKQTER